MTPVEKGRTAFWGSVRSWARSLQHWRASWSPGPQGSGVCDAGVDGEGADGAVVLESLPADLDGGGGEAVLGEDAGDGGVLGEGEDGEVVAGFGLDGAGGSDPDAANGEQGGGEGED